MTNEVRQYLWLRLTILGTGLAIFTSLVIASVQLWPMAQRAMFPTKLACGCAVVSVTTPWWMNGIILAVISLTVISFVWFITLFVKQTIRSRRQEQLLRQNKIQQVFADSIDVDVHHVASDNPFAMTVGFFHPKIYVSRGLLQQLTSDEYKAVLLHERAHQVVYDPLATALMSVISSMLRYVPGARDWMSAVYSLRELAADAVATNGYQKTDDLSSAFLKLSTTTLHPSISAFSPNRDRLEKLLNHQWQLPRRWWSWSAAAVVGVIVIGTLSLGHFAAAESPKVPPAAAAACHETMVMCQIEHLPSLPAAWLCADGRCVSTSRLWSPMYVRTSAR